MSDKALGELGGRFRRSAGRTGVRLLSAGTARTAGITEAQRFAVVTPLQDKRLTRTAMRTRATPGFSLCAQIRTTSRAWRAPTPAARARCTWSGSGARRNGGTHAKAWAGRAVCPRCDDGAPGRDRARRLVRRPGRRRAVQSHGQAANGSFRNPLTLRVIRPPHHLDFRPEKARFVSVGHHGASPAARTSRARTT